MESFTSFIAEKLHLSFYVINSHGVLEDLVLTLCAGSRRIPDFSSLCFQVGRVLNAKDLMNVTLPITYILLMLVLMLISMWEGIKW
jgi:hypothetical protein